MKPVIFALLAGLCWGIGEVCTRSVLHSGKIGPMTVLFVRASVMLAGASVAYAFARQEPAQWWRADTPTLMKLILGSGLAAGFLGVLFFYLALAKGDVSRIKPIAFTTAPAIAVILGVTLLGEPFTLRKALGVGALLIGVVLVTGSK